LLDETMMTPAQPRNPWPSRAGELLIAPSLLACDVTHITEQIRAALAGGADVLHVDVMDGVFVPMGPDIVCALRELTTGPLDVHLMVVDPEAQAEPFILAGADSITFHVEATDDPTGLIETLRRAGVGVGITLKPGTPVDSLSDYLPLVDQVLVMTVEPGKGGQAFMSDMLDRIAEVASKLRDDQVLAVDGGIRPDTATLTARAGATMFIAGSAVFNDTGDIAGNIAALRSGAQEGRR
jgi:ribulose-phosphate 3-epimerase